MMNRMFGLLSVAFSAATAAKQERRMAKDKSIRIELENFSRFVIIMSTLCGNPGEHNSSPGGYFRLSATARSIPALLRFGKRRFREEQFLSTRWHNRNCTLSNFLFCKPGATPDGAQWNLE